MEDRMGADLIDALKEDVENAQLIASSIVEVSQAFDDSHEDKESIEVLQDRISRIQHALTQILSPQYQSRFREWDRDFGNVSIRIIKHCSIELANLHWELQLGDKGVTKSQPESIRSPLLSLIQVADDIAAKLDTYAMINMSREHKNVLHGAASEGHTKVVKMLLEFGADTNLIGYRYGTALHGAASNGHTDVVRMLLDYGADVDLAAGIFKTALNIAVSRGHTDVVKVLLNCGADINLTGGIDGTALHGAAGRGHIELVKLLLKEGANIDQVVEPDGTALYTAVSRGQTGVVKVLLNYGADVNLTGGVFGTPLHEAASEGHIELVEILLRKGANIDQTDRFGTALHVAASKGHTGVFKVLLDYGADANLTGGKYRTVLNEAAGGGHTEIVELLLKKGANVDEIDDKYGTALHIAASKGQTDVIKMLLDYGADANLTGGIDGTALHGAAGRGHTEVVELLLKKGANIDQTEDRNLTALHVAASRGHTAVVKVLLGYGADADLTGGVLAKGTALQSAISAGHIEMTEALLEAGAHIDSFQMRDTSYAQTLLHVISGRLNRILQIYFDQPELGGEDPSPRIWLVGQTIQSQPHFREFVAQNELVVKLLFHHKVPANKFPPMNEAQRLAPDHFPSCAHFTSDSGNTPAHLASSSSLETLRDIDQFLEDPSTHFERLGELREHASIFGGLGWTSFLQGMKFSRRPVRLLSHIIDYLNAWQYDNGIIYWTVALCCGAYFTMVELRHNRLFCDSVPLLIEKQHFNQIEVVRLEESEVWLLISNLVTWSRNPVLLRDNSGGMDKSVFARLWQQITEILRKFNVTSPQLDEVCLNLQCVLYFLALTARCLCAAVHLCAWSYVGDLGAEVFARGMFIDGRMIVDGACPGIESHGPKIILHQRNLSCLGNMLGGPVWTFRVENEASLSTDNIGLHQSCNLLAKAEDVVELWGAGAYIWEMTQGSCDPALTQVIIGGGRIVGVKGLNDSSNSSPNVMAHWISHAGYATWTNPSTYLPTRSQVLIGSPVNESLQTIPELTITESSENLPSGNVSLGKVLSGNVSLGNLSSRNQYSGLQRNLHCSLTPEKAFQKFCIQLLDLEAEKSKLRLQLYRSIGFQSTLGGPFVKFSLAGVVKWYPGRKLKNDIIDRLKTGGVKGLLGIWGLEMSICTRNARRVPLYTLLRHGGVLSEVEDRMSTRVIKTWRRYRSHIETALKMNSNDFKNWWSKLREQEVEILECVLCAFEIALNILTKTGMDDWEMKVWYPTEISSSIQPKYVPCRSKWNTFTQDTHDCATFALTSYDCLVPHIPPTDMQYQQCNNDESSSLAKSTVLLCPIYVEQPDALKSGSLYRVRDKGVLRIISVSDDFKLCVAVWEKWSLGLIDRIRHHRMKTAVENGDEVGATWFCIV